MTVNSGSLRHSTPFTGLNTFTYNLETAGLYRVEVVATIPCQSIAQSSAVNIPSQEIQTVTLVADSSGSLNSKYWTFYTAGNTTGYYVWYNINSAGVDPAPAGLTGIPVVGATNATATTLATATATAINAAVPKAILSATSATTAVTLTSQSVGTATAAANSSGASPGFSYAVTAAGSYGLASGLNIQVGHSGTVYTLANPSIYQQQLAGQTQIRCAAGDVITVAFSSLAPADALPNAVKAVINLYFLTP